MSTVARALYRGEFKSSHYVETLQHVVQGQSLKQQAEMWHFTEKVEAKIQQSGGKYYLYYPNKVILYKQMMRNQKFGQLELE